MKRPKQNAKIHEFPFRCGDAVRHPTHRKVLYIVGMRMSSEGVSSIREITIEATNESFEGFSFLRQKPRKEKYVYVEDTADKFHLLARYPEGRMLRN